jgi:hypothetical protein
MRKIWSTKMPVNLLNIILCTWFTFIRRPASLWLLETFSLFLILCRDSVVEILTQAWENLPVLHEFSLTWLVLLRCNNLRQTRVRVIYCYQARRLSSKTYCPQISLSRKARIVFNALLIPFRRAVWRSRWPRRSQNDASLITVSFLTSVNFIEILCESTI